MYVCEYERGPRSNFIVPPWSRGEICPWEKALPEGNAYFQNGSGNRHFGPQEVFAHMLKNFSEEQCACVCPFVYIYWVP